MEVAGLTIEADPFDGPGHIFWKKGLTEPETRNLVDRLLTSGAVMFDVGAYVGQFSLVAAQLGYSRVYAFEPTPSVFRQLQRNVTLNGCNNVTCVSTALSDHIGTMRFYTYPGSADQNSLWPLHPTMARSFEVPVTTIDAVVSEQALERIDVIKIDVEGNELAVLLGAGATLKELRPTLIIEISRHQQAYGYSGFDIHALLTKQRYNCFHIGAGGLIPYVPRRDEIHAACTHFNIAALPGEQKAPEFVY
jgi:FkbM family methyltransferase